MATLPSPEALGRRPVPRPQANIAKISTAAVSAGADAAYDLGKDITQVGNTMLERTALNVARERDAQISDELRDLMYNPESGYMNTRGRQAMDVRGALDERLQELEGKYGEGLNNAARDRLITSLRSRVDRAMQSADNHLVGQSRAYEQSVAEAGIVSAREDVAVGALPFEEGLSNALTITRQAMLDAGQAPEAIDLAIRSQTREFYSDEINRRLTTDPLGALGFLDENKDQLGTDYDDLRRTIEPRAMQQLGTIRAQEDFRAMPADLRHSVPIVSELTSRSNRPHMPSPVITGMAGRAIENTSAQHPELQGAKIVIHSGTETHSHDQSQDRSQYGSENHETGHAMDFKIQLADGSFLANDSPAARSVRLEAAKAGVLGVGFATNNTYMGPHSMHFDVVNYGNGLRTWEAGQQEQAALRAASQDAPRQYDVAPGDRSAARGAQTLDDLELPDLEEVSNTLLELMSQDQTGRAVSAYQSNYRLQADMLEDKAAREIAEQNLAIVVRAHRGDANWRDDFSPEQIAAMGADRVDELDELYAVSRDQSRTTNESFHDRLYMLSDNEFMSLDLSASSYTENLSSADLRSALDRQRKIRDEAGQGPFVPRSYSTHRGNVDNYPATMGLDEDVRNGIASRLVRWEEEQGEKPTDSQLAQQAAFLATSIIVDATFWSGGVSGMLSEFDFGGQQTRPTEDDLTLDMLTDAVENQLEIGGQSVSPEELQDAIEAANGDLEQTLHNIILLKRRFGG